MRVDNLGCVWFGQDNSKKYWTGWKYFSKQAVFALKGILMVIVFVQISYQKKWYKYTETAGLVL